MRDSLYWWRCDGILPSPYFAWLSSTCKVLFSILFIQFLRGEGIRKKPIRREILVAEKRHVARLALSDFFWYFKSVGTYVVALLKDIYMVSAISIISLVREWAITNVLFVFVLGSSDVAIIITRPTNAYGCDVGMVAMYVSNISQYDVICALYPMRGAYLLSMDKFGSLPHVSIIFPRFAHRYERYLRCIALVILYYDFRASSVLVDRSHIGDVIIYSIATKEYFIIFILILSDLSFCVLYTCDVDFISADVVDSSVNSAICS